MRLPKKLSLPNSTASNMMSKLNLSGGKGKINAFGENIGKAATEKFRKSMGGYQAVEAASSAESVVDEKVFE